MASRYPHLESCDPRTCTNSMLRRCERVVAGVYRRHLAQFGITSSQLSLLFVTAKMERVTQVELTSILQLEKSSVNRNLNRLLNDGSIMKKADRSLAITQKGKVLLETVIPAWECAKLEVNELLGNDGVAALHLLQQKLLEE